MSPGRLLLTWTSASISQADAVEFSNSHWNFISLLIKIYNKYVRLRQAV